MKQQIHCPYQPKQSPSFRLEYMFLYVSDPADARAGLGVIGILNFNFKITVSMKTIKLGRCITHSGNIEVKLNG